VYWSGAHLLNTLTLLACLALTAWWSNGRRALRMRGRPAWMAGASLFSVVLLGITGVIAALGDTLFPARSLAEGLQQDLDPASGIFLRLRVLHPFLALATAVWLFYYTMRRGAALPRADRYASRVMTMVGLQLAIGAFNWLMLAPVWTQLLHLLAADLLWIALVLFAAETLET
jgi:heme A synthase